MQFQLELQDIAFHLIIALSALLLLGFIVASIAFLLIVLGTPDDFNDVDIQGKPNKEKDR